MAEFLDDRLRSLLIWLVGFLAMAEAAVAALVELANGSLTGFTIWTLGALMMLATAVAAENIKRTGAR